MCCIAKVQISGETVGKMEPEKQLELVDDVKEEDIVVKQIKVKEEKKPEEKSPIKENDVVQTLDDLKAKAAAEGKKLQGNKLQNIKTEVCKVEGKKSPFCPLFLQRSVICLTL